MKKCILISRFNVSNIGDLAISNILFNILQQKFEVDRYNLFGDCKKVYDINNISHKHVSKSKMELEIFINKYKLNKIIKKYSEVKKKLRNTNLELEKIIDQYDLVIVGGGNMIYETDTSFKTIYRFEKYVNMSINKLKPIVVLDIGIGPFKTKEQVEYAVQLLSKCDYITFRDKASYNLYVNNGGDTEKASISVDPVFMLPKRSKKGKKPSKTIGVNIFNNKLIGANSGEYKASVEAYAKLVNNLIIQEDRNVVLFVTENLDRYALEDVYSQIDNKDRVRIQEIRGLDQLVRLYEEIDILIGTRMHSMIIAYTQIVPIIGLSWQTKVDELFNIINKKEYLFDFENLHKSILEIEKCCDSITNKLDEEKKYINEQLINIRDKYDVTLKVINRFK